jgi:hypothetical protein
MIQARAARVLWFMLAVSACWVIYLAAATYTACRAGGTQPLPCFVWALISGCLEALAFAIITALKILILVLP